MLLPPNGPRCLPTVCRFPLKELEKVSGKSVVVKVMDEETPSRE